jgi:CO/xanthine dehydrogenase FAD-binding subunit
MITTYHRPKTLEEALQLLERPQTYPLGGGTLLNSPAFKGQDIEVVDLQDLKLNHIRKHGERLEIGATATLEQILQNEHTPPALLQAIRQEATLNIRNMATAAGALLGCDGRSAFAVAMLALDAQIHTADGASIGLVELLSLRGAKRLVTAITISLAVSLTYEQVARTPADLPIVALSLAQWKSGRTRIAIGGFGKAPTLALDGTASDGAEEAARNACHEATDKWASAEYRMDIAATLARRALETV